MAIGWRLLFGAFVCLAASAQPPALDWAGRLISADEAEEGFYPLYNGGDLDGWVICGPDKAAFQPRGDVLAATGQGSGAWLATVDAYEHFILRFRYRSPSHAPVLGVLPGPKSDGAARIEIRPAGADALQAEWNEVEVTCDGGRIRASLNGAGFMDAAGVAGHIAIRGGDQPAEFGAIRIKPLPGGEGWRAAGGEPRTVVDWDAFEMQCAFKPAADAQGALVFFDRREKPLFEVRLDNHHAEEFTGSIAGKAPALELRALDQCWNEMRVRAAGPNVRVWVNGKTVADLVLTRRVSCAGGRIGFPVSRGSIEFRDVEVRPVREGATS